MKKVFLFVTAICGFSAAAIASVTYTTTCGVKYVGPDQNYFETWGDYWDWRNEMNVVYCGEGIRELVGPGDDPIPAL